MTWKHRYTILAVICGANALSFMDRMVMASAIPFIAKDFHLSPLAMGAVLSAFFLGYAAMQLPGGLLSDRFGPRLVLAGSIAWWSLMTALTGLAPGLTALMAIRFLFGLGEGPFPAAASKALSIWFPRTEIARAMGLQLATIGLGAATAPLFVGALIVTWGWRWVYFTLFAPGILLVALIFWFMRNSGAESRCVEPPETAQSDPHQPARAALWASLATALTPAIWWCAAALFMTNIVAWGLLNWLPTYLLEARHFGLSKMTILSAAINLIAAFSFALGGFIADRFFSQRLYRLIILSSLASALFVFLAGRAPTGNQAAVYLAGLFLVFGLGSAPLFTLPIVLVPKHAVGSAAGFVNTAGQLAGVLSPLLVGYLLQTTHGDFTIVLNAMAVTALLAIIPPLFIRQRPPPQPA
jgi:MFS family permease